MDKKILCFAIMALFLISATGVAQQRGPPADIQEQGIDIEQPEEQKGPPEEAIGGYVSQNIAQEKVREIRELIKSENFTGKDIAAIAKQIGVEVKEYVLVKVDEVRNERAKEVAETEDIEETVKFGKAVKYDHAANEFGERMEATIQRLQERGIDTTRLEEVKNGFYTKFIELQETENPEEAVNEMRSLASQFREEARESAGEEADEVEQEIESDLEGKKPELDKVKQGNWEHLEEVALMVFDRHITAAENQLEVFETKVGLDATELRAKLDEIKAKRTDLEAAYGAQDRQQVNSVNSEIRALWIEFRQAHSKIVREQIAGQSIEKLEDITAKADELIEDAEEKGVDAAEAKAMAAEIKALVAEARADYDAANYGKARDDLDNIKPKFGEFRQKIQDLVSRMRGAEE